MKFAIYLCANLFVALKFVTLLDFSGQNFIWWNINAWLFSATRLSWIKSSCWFASDNEVDNSSHIITKKKKNNNSSSSEWNWPNNWTITFIGGAVVILVMEIHTDFLVLLQTPDMTLTRLNQILYEWFIFQGKALIITNKKKRTAPVLSI